MEHVTLTRQDFAAMRRWLKDNPGKSVRDCVDALDLADDLAWPRPMVPPPRPKPPPPKYCDACGMAITENGMCRC